MREAFENDLSHAEGDRRIQICRIRRIAKVLADQNLVVLAGALYTHPE